MGSDSSKNSLTFPIDVSLSSTLFYGSLILLRRNRELIFRRALVKVDLGTPYSLIMARYEKFNITLVQHVYLISQLVYDCWPGLNQIISQAHRGILWWLMFYISFIYFLLVRLKIVDEVLDLSGADDKLSQCREDGDFILDGYPWMLSGAFEYTCQVPLLRVLRCMEELLGTSTEVYLL